MSSLFPFNFFFGKLFPFKITFTIKLQKGKEQLHEKIYEKI